MTRTGTTTGDLRASRHATAQPPRPWGLRPCLHAACLSWAQEQRFIHPTDSSFFWAVLFATPVIWAILGFLALITFKVMWGLLTGAPGALQPRTRDAGVLAPPFHPFHPPAYSRGVAGVALTCNAVNVIGYVKCKKDARKKLSALGGSVMLKGMEMWSSRKGASSGA